MAGPHEIPPANEMTGMKVFKVMSMNVPKNETGKPDDTTITRRMEIVRRLESGKDGNLDKNWKLLRECRAFIMENSDVWLQITERDAKRPEKEGKETRIELQKQKKIKFWKAGNMQVEQR